MNKIDLSSNPRSRNIFAKSTNFRIKRHRQHNWYCCHKLLNVGFKSSACIKLGLWKTFSSYSSNSPLIFLNYYYFLPKWLPSKRKEGMTDTTKNTLEVTQGVQPHHSPAANPRLGAAPRSCEPAYPPHQCYLSPAPPRAPSSPATPPVHRGVVSARFSCSATG